MTEEPGGLQYTGSQRVGHDWEQLNTDESFGFKEITFNISSDENSKTSALHMEATILALPMHFKKNHVYVLLNRREEYCSYH